jgi:hypothetical protein
MIPREAFMHRIMVLTGGQVAPNDFYALENVQSNA